MKLINAQAVAAAGEKNPSRKSPRPISTPTRAGMAALSPHPRLDTPARRQGVARNHPRRYRRRHAHARDRARTRLQRPRRRRQSDLQEKDRPAQRRNAEPLPGRARRAVHLGAGASAWFRAVSSRRPAMSKRIRKRAAACATCPTMNATACWHACGESTWPRLYVFVLMALTTGARRGELLGLRWCDVDLRARRGRIARHQKRRPPCPGAVAASDRRAGALRAEGCRQPARRWSFAPACGRRSPTRPPRYSTKRCSGRHQEFSLSRLPPLHRVLHGAKRRVAVGDRRHPRPSPAAHGATLCAPQHRQPAPAADRRLRREN